MKFLLMKRTFCIVFFFLFFLGSTANAMEKYGDKGGFDLSTGLTMLSTSNDEGGQEYGISTLPYANHFILNKFFLRYETLIGVSYYLRTFRSFAVSLGGGLGFGYSFSLSGNWVLNLSLGYAGAILSENQSSSGWVSTGDQTVNMHPELKYLISERWTVGALMRMVTNLPDMVVGRSSTFSLGTRTYIIVSYLF